MTKLSFSRILPGLLLTTALCLATPVFASSQIPTGSAPVAAKNFDGHALYNKLFAILQATDIALIKPDVRAKWIATWKDRYAKAPLNTEDLADQACLTMMLSLHELHDYYFKPDKTKAEKAQMQSDFGGIGAPITIKNANDFLKGLSKTSTQEEIAAAMKSAQTVSADHPLIVADAPDADSPAGKAGIHKGDALLMLNGRSLNGMSIQEVVDNIHGKIDTTIHLTMQRTAADGTTSTQELTLVRKMILLHAVHSTDEGDGITYTKIDQFESQYLLPDWKKAAEQAAKGQGLILDLRNNPGGILQFAEPLAASMLKQGTLVELQERHGDSLMVERTELLPEAVVGVIYDAAKPDKRNILVNTKRPQLAIPEDMPIVVLINESSASASELTAGALQANHRAILVGEDSRGKGVGQKMFALGNGRSTHVTVFQFLPGGVANDRVALIPDRKVQEGDKDVIKDGDPANDTQLRAAIAVIKEELAKKAAIAKAKAEHGKGYDAETDDVIGAMQDSLAKGHMPY
jgi:carboxyl-terminal processing protease